MLYNNICIKLPTNPRPAATSLTPYVTAEAFLVLVEVELVPVLVPLELTPLVASAVVLHVNVPWMTLPASALNPLQSMEVVLCMLKPPLTLVRAGKEGLKLGLAFDDYDGVFKPTS
jgi:hypothetical protein